jgi:hypothetical protein
LKATFCPSFEAIASALQRNKAVHFGLLVDSGFSPDSNGVIHAKRGHSGGGHAVLAVGMKKIGAEWYLVMQNSWGESWGGSKDGTVPKGCCLLHPSYVETMFGSFAYSAVVSPSDDAIAFYFYEESNHGEFRILGRNSALDAAHRPVCFDRPCPLAL